MIKFTRERGNILFYTSYNLIYFEYLATVNNKLSLLYFNGIVYVYCIDYIYIIATFDFCPLRNLFAQNHIKMRCSNSFYLLRA